MKYLNIKLLVLVSLVFSNLAFSQNKGVGNPTVTQLPSKEKRWALIIGVDAYQKDISPLYGTVNDAKALREVLIKYAGFADEQIILMTTDSNDANLRPTYGNIIDQLDKLKRVVPEGGLILFSFSGHGVSIGNDAFIVPSDGRIYQDADLMRKRSIDVLEIKRAIQATKVKQVIMFLDSCRNDPVRAKGDVDNKLTTAYKQGLSFETKNQNIEAYATLYATSFGDRAYEFLDKKTNKYRGYFSYAIEEGLNGLAANDKGEVTLGSLIRYIGDTVKERVRINEDRKQIPFLDIGGSFTNGDLLIAVAERTTPIITNTNSDLNKENQQQVSRKSYVVGDFIVELSMCKASRGYLNCSFNLRNTNPVDRRICILKSLNEILDRGTDFYNDGIPSRAVDTMGNEYILENTLIGGNTTTTGRIHCATIVPDTITRIELVFSSKSGIQNLSLLRLELGNYSLDVSYYRNTRIERVKRINKSLLAIFKDVEVVKSS